MWKQHRVRRTDVIREPRSPTSTRAAVLAGVGITDHSAIYTLISLNIRVSVINQMAPPNLWSASHRARVSQRARAHARPGEGRIYMHETACHPEGPDRGSTPLVPLVASL